MSDHCEMDQGGDIDGIPDRLDEAHETGKVSVGFE